jgi:hypothetical protein
MPPAPASTSTSTLNSSLCSCVALLGLLEHGDQLAGIARRVEALALQQQRAVAVGSLK